jgi:hypothetical protein
MPSESIWYEDPHEFLSFKNFTRILPLPNEPYAEQLNTVLRLALYYGLLVTLFGRGYVMLWIPVIVAGITFLLYRSFQRSPKPMVATSPLPDGESCTKPSKHNPFMNVLASDARSRNPACDPLDPNVKKKVSEKFSGSMFYDIDDVWARNNAGRTFYTTPVTTVPNDQTSFAEWLYSGVRAGGKQTRPPRNSIF